MQENSNLRFILLIVLSFGILFVWQILFPPPTPETENETFVESAAEDKRQVLHVEKVAQDVEERKVTLENGNVRIVLTNIGGGKATDFAIKNPDRYAKNPDFLEGVKHFEGENASGEIRYPFETVIPTLGIDEKSPFVLSASDSQSALFTYSDPAGRFVIEKNYRLSDASPDDKAESAYAIVHKVTVKNTGAFDIRDKMQFVLHNKAGKDSEGSFLKPADQIGAKCYGDESIHTVYQGDDPEKAENFDKDIQWIAADESYFAMVAQSYNIESCSLFEKDNLVRSTMQMALNVPAGKEYGTEIKIYMGPKEAQYLDRFGHDAVKVIDYGWLEILAKPMASLLSFLYRFSGNWGLAIILLTIMVRILLWPIAQKSQKSMMQMQRINPQLQELQKQYKNDPQMLQQKQMQLYKENNVNPFGCLPLLLQMPIFFALYRTIFTTGGLYNADFMLWIHDLSSPDPYFVLPLLTVALFVAQQLLTPNSMQTMQQRIMIFSMPIIFGIMMLFLPSGLNLYMFVSSLFSILQSYLVRRKFAQEDAALALATGAGAMETENSSAKDRRAAQRRKQRENNDE